MWTGVQDGQDKGAYADSCKLARCKGKLRLALCRSYFFGVMTEMSCGSVVPFCTKEARLVHKQFLSLFPFPFLLQVPLKSLSVYAKTQPDVSEPQHNILAKASTCPELLISSAWRPSFRPACSELPANLTRVSPLRRSQNIISGTLLCFLPRGSHRE